MGRKRRISEQERALFREAVADARPLSAEERIQPERERPPPVPQQRQLDEQRVLRDLLSDPLDEAEMETGDELLFARPGMQHGVIRKLRRGQYSVQAALDLHGYTVAEARTALVEFLAESQRRGARCVRIIHGKGNRSLNRQPVLKGKVNHWLQQRDEVLAFCSTPPVDGGTGAVYVLLKRG